MTDHVRTIEIPVPDGSADAYFAGPDDRSAPMADTASYQEEGAERHYRALESLLERTLR